MNHERPDIFDSKWTLRDIKAERNNLVAAKPRHITELVDRRLVEIIADTPVITEAGHCLIQLPETETK